MSERNHRAGFVAIAGRPNVGKSTLLNAFVGEKLAITGPQPQTTRTSLQGVLTSPGTQIVFVDTPGIHRSDTPFNKRMMETVRGALHNRDLVLYVADASKPLNEEDEHAVGALVHSEKTLLVLNKIDRLEDKRQLLPVIERYQKLFPFSEAIPVSARTGDGMERLKRAIVDQLPDSPPLFPEDHLTDQPVRFMAAEIIREQILRAAREEVPHAAAVLIDRWEERPSLTRIAATIYVERPGQKTILIGAKGGQLKKIGTQARQEIERLIGSKVFLSLFVKVKPKWRESSEFLDAIDWRAAVGNEQGD
jgi:GTP-binding protein Era